MIYFTILSYAFNIHIILLYNIYNKCIFHGLVSKVYTTINENFNLKYTSEFRYCH